MNSGLRIGTPGISIAGWWLFEGRIAKYCRRDWRAFLGGLSTYLDADQKGKPIRVYIFIVQNFTQHGAKP
jgi:hypothetical protein